MGGVVRPKSLPCCPQASTLAAALWACWCPWSPCPSDLAPFPPFQENLGPSRRRSPGPSASRGQQGEAGRPLSTGQAGTWAGHPAAGRRQSEEQPRRGGSKGRGGEFGAGVPSSLEVACLDCRPQIQGRSRGAGVCLKSVGEAQCCPVALSVSALKGFLLHPSFTVFFFGPSLHSFSSLFPFFFSPLDQRCGYSPCLFLSPVLRSAVCLVICLPFPLSLFDGIWWVLSSTCAFPHSCVRAHMLSLCHSLN